MGGTGQNITQTDACALTMHLRTPTLAIVTVTVTGLLLAPAAQANNKTIAPARH